MRIVIAVGVAAVLTLSSAVLAQNQPWNNFGLAQTPEQQPSTAATAPAPRRDLSGIWDAGGGGIAGPGHVASPFTPAGLDAIKAIKPGNGPRIAPVKEINDPLSTKADPAGFPRILLYELRPVQIVQTPSSVLMLYMFEKRWRVIWTDGRQLPADPDPRWYGYSVGRWEDDFTFIVQSNGTDDRTWLDNAGNPHTRDLRVEERYRRASRDVLELTVTITDPEYYTKPWTPRNKLPMRLLPPTTDLMEMIPSATEAALYAREISSQAGAVK